MIFEYLSKKLLDEIYNTIRKIASDNKSSVASSEKDLENSLNHHLNIIQNWSEQISFKDAHTYKFTNQVYVELDLYLTPLKLHLDQSERCRTMSIRDVISRHRHSIILGQPGAGKTTSMKRLCQICLFEPELTPGNFPLYFSLRDISGTSKSLFDLILKSLGIVIKTELENSEELLQQIACELLERLGPVIIFDGYDEVNADLKVKIDSGVKTLALSLNNAVLYLTSRSNDYDLQIENADIFELKELTVEQIRLFANKWIEDEDFTDEFLKQLNKSPLADTAIRPLTLAHLCAIFQRVGKIPDKPKTVYKKIVNLLLEEWDEQKNVRRVSKYADFEIDRKREFLSYLAFELTKQGKLRFTSDHLKEIYLKVLVENFNLPRNQVKVVVKELENHTGLIFQSSYTEFEFAHKSIQEYLCAEYIVGLPVSIFDFDVILKIPNEMAIAVALSSNPTQYLGSFLIGCIFKNRWLDVSDFSLLKYGTNFEVIVEVVNILKTFIPAFFNRIIIEKIDFNASPIFAATLIYVLKIINTFDASFQDKPSLIIKELLMTENGQKSIDQLRILYRVFQKQFEKDKDSFVPYHDGIMMPYCMELHRF